ncbi:YciI family protein [Mycolicibacterium sp. Dal123E01]|uniref:YciI family protein n=1 Tax=Mycolicibacterium sp. Dal123E01 TaxID=3457578 RepID=UPI00403EDDE6
MFHVLIGTYTQPAEVVEKTRPAHLAWLQDEVDAGRLLVAGRQESGVGGLLFTTDIDTEVVQDIIDRDPYTLAGAATYQRISFNGGVRAAGL